MDFMGFHIIDIIIVSLVAFLAIKGLVNGFSKELLNFITIVAGVMLAARYNTSVVQFINEQNLFPQIPDDFARILGFVLIIIAIWLLTGFISSIITKVTSNASGFLSRLGGYLLSAARYVFIFSLIIYGVSLSDFFKKSAIKFKNETKLFQPMTQLGASILNLDVNNSTPEVNNSTSTKEMNLTIKPSTPLIEHNSSN